jgi:NAD-dependent deacetylase
MPPARVPEGLAERVAAARHVMVLTGAGISAESGVPTFREAQTGLWSRFRPEELATAEAFAEDPDTVWAWYEWRRDLVAAAGPNAGHAALAKLERMLPRLTLVTQNVDGLHQRAGSPDPVEFHGNLFDNRCFDCGRPAPDVPRPCPALPRCDACGGWIRPGVVWFGEAIPTAALQRSFSAAEDCDLFLSIGTSSLVYPAAGLAERAAARGAALVEINPAPTELARHAVCAWASPAGEALPALATALGDMPAAPQEAR